MFLTSPGSEATVRVLAGMPVQIFTYKVQDPSTPLNVSTIINSYLGLLEPRVMGYTYG